MLRLLLVWFAAALLLTACRDADAPAPPDPEPLAAASEQPAASTERGTGTLVLDGVSYAFTVRACDVSGDVDDAVQTLAGRGTTPEGESFDVFVSRNDAAGMLTHTVSFQTGDVLRGEGTVLEAQRIRMNDRWTSVRGEAAGPLVRIDGNRIAAEGRFGPVEGLDEAEAVAGRLEATCG